MTPDDYYLPVTVFVERYPTPLKDPRQAWANRLRVWRIDGPFQSGLHYRSRVFPHCNKLVFVYHERAVLVMVYNHRADDTFCGLVWQHNFVCITTLLHPDKVPNVANVLTS